MKCALGIDLGGTNLKLIAVTPAGKVISRAAVPHALRGKNWKKNVRHAFDDFVAALPNPPDSIGVATPGLPAPDHKSIAHMPGRLPGLEGLIWKKFLNSPRPVPVINDAQAALLGEVWLGAARGAQNAILLTLGTGVGGAAIVDGRVLHGHIGRAGHLGHISLDPFAPRDVANTPGSLENAIGDCTVKTRTRGRFDSTEALVRAAQNGDPQAARQWVDSVRALAAAIASLVNVLDPETVVIGGGIAKAGPALFTPLNQFLKKFEWRPAGQKVRLVPAQLADQAGAFGAARTAMHPPP
jgi:glucokinase